MARGVRFRLVVRDLRRKTTRTGPDLFASIPPLDVIKAVLVFGPARSGRRHRCGAERCDQRPLERQGSTGRMEITSRGDGWRLREASAAVDERTTAATWRKRACCAARRRRQLFHNAATGEEASKKEDVGEDEGELTKEESTKYRRVASRANRVAVAWADIQVVRKNVRLL